ncbi:MAG: hypothetical protein Q9220_001523 [cf. Caloplaca sp. 1 TL-2023]
MYWLLSLHWHFIIACLTQNITGQGFAQFVDPFFGTEGGGNMFPGVVSAPFANVRLGPDVNSGSADAYSGYLSTGNITGFSLMHLSGTGGAPKYGVVGQQPVAGSGINPLGNFSVSRSAADQSEIGWYKSSLSNGVTVELAASNHAGMLSYQFPPDEPANIIVDVSHFLPSHRGFGTGQRYVNGNISIVQTGNGQSSYEGSATFNNGWNLACDFVDTEMPASVSLADLAANAKAKWNQQVLSKIKADINDTETLRLLYSSLYGMHIMPSNRTGENPLWESTEPYYDDIMTFWDLFRCSTSLVQIIHPDGYQEQIRSLVDISRHDGYMPDSRSSNYNGRTQGGSNADNILADAFVKGVEGGMRWQDGHAAMVRDAAVTLSDACLGTAPPDSCNRHGRGALPDWLKYHYISTNYTRSVGRAVEYAVNDFALYQVSQGLGKIHDAAKYLNRSRNWRHHWDPEATSLNISGFLMPRSPNGTFVAQDPLDCGGCYWDDDYYEALPWEYTFNAHHDIYTLIQYAGGADTFIRRLDITFQDNQNPHGLSYFNKTIFNPSNEVSFTTPYLYHFAGRQDISVKQSRSIAKSYYNAGRSGLPGNSDSGAMQSWLLWNMIGLYPITGQTTFLIGSPWFGMTIHLGEGKTLKITIKGIETGSAFYVQSLQVNGRIWEQNWLTWEDVFARGGTMDFVLGREPSQWSWGGPLPPSPAS